MKGLAVGFLGLVRCAYHAVPFARREQGHKYGDGGEPFGVVKHQRNGDYRQEHAEQHAQHALAGTAQLPGMLLAHGHATASESSAPKRRSRAANWFSAAVNASRSKSGHRVSRNRSSA